MNARKLVIIVVACVGIAAGAGYGLYRLGLDRGMKMSAASPASTEDTAATKAGDADPTNGKKILYWHDPMVPGQKFDKAGKSPFMDMDLVPVYAEAGDADDSSVSVSPRVQQNLGVRTADVVLGSISVAVEAVGSAAYNERDAAVVQARSNGFLERLHVRALLDPVRRGQPLAEIYVPDWVAAQEELLAARRIAAQSSGNGLDGLVDAARQRMRLAGMSDEQIRRVESTGRVQARATLTAPISGVVAELPAREGMTVMAGAPLFRINGLTTIWINADVPERVAAQMRSGDPVDARVAALPGVVFKGKVSAILPEVNPATRTIKARVELANPGGQLVPGMFATVSFSPAARKGVLLVPSEAVIQTGKRSVVLVAQGEGRFSPVDVDVGLDSNGRTEIRHGLNAGQKVVVSGQFLIDSEANLRASINRLGADGAPTASEREKR
ncbi:MAG TPA: efflux RND transporter periplasmic adaptor subunit [Casimicrobiaceae bacterium]|nr:efflux RND transporter periplasmic adaptor subunit [Casimicrobiaceae bacterium]